MIILLFFAFLAGFVTVLSPCILPILPLLLAAGIGQGRYRSLGIISGLVVSFSFFTLSLTALVHALGISPDFLRYAAIVCIGAFGLMMIFPKLGDWFAAHTAGIAKIGLLVQEKSTLVGTGFMSGFILGIALGLLWTPCAGPILAAITTLVATRAVTFYAVLVTITYSIGAAIPMFLIAYGSNKIVNATTKLSNYAETIRRIFGVLMILGAGAIALHGDVWLQQLTLHYFPMITIEDNALVKKELEKIRSNEQKNNSMYGGKARDFVGINAWINSIPLSLEKLKGKVVLVDFWTYSCINCVRTFPYLKRWYADYKDKGLVIVGVHTPEFEFEKNQKNVQDAVKRFGIEYPVAMDNDYKTWQNYNNHYWPAHYLIDQEGIIQEKHFGEGAYQETENIIRSLLGLPAVSESKEAAPTKKLTPETYLGYARARAYLPEITLKKNQTADYSYATLVGDDQIGLKGQWYVGAEFIKAENDADTLNLNFIASRVYLVMQSEQPRLITVLLDKKPVPNKYYTVDMNAQGQIQVSQARMYDILDLKGDYGRHMLTLKVPKGVSLYAFTFGGGQE